MGVAARKRQRRFAVRALHQPDVKSKLLDQGLFAQSGTPEALSALLRSELAK